MNMAFLSSFRIGQQAVYPEELRERLESFALLENIGDAALRHLLSESNWFCLPGGTLLERDGEKDAALFLVVTGCLGIFVPDAQGQRRMVALAPAVTAPRATTCPKKMGESLEWQSVQPRAPSACLAGRTSWPKAQA